VYPYSGMNAIVPVLIILPGMLPVRLVTLGILVLVLLVPENPFAGRDAAGNALFTAPG